MFIKILQLKSNFIYNFLQETFFTELCILELNFQILGMNTIDFNDKRILKFPWFCSNILYKKDFQKVSKRS